MKECKIEGCNNPVWSKGLCRNHIPKTALKKISKKDPEERNKMSTFLIGIWNKRTDHVCYNCGKWLGSEPLSYIFDHILEKGNENYKHLCYNKENICYLCLTCHDNKTRGFLTEKLLLLRNTTISNLCQ